MYSHATEPNKPRHTLVIGFGNTLRSDDGAGPVVAKLLADRLAAEQASGVVALAVIQLLPELAENISRSKCVIFIDASVKVPVGRLDVGRIQSHRPEEHPSRLGHHETPERLLAICEKVFGDVPPAFVLAIGAASLELGSHLSRAVKPAVRELANHLFEGLVRKGQNYSKPTPSWNPWHSPEAIHIWTNMCEAATVENPFIGKGII